MSAPHLARALLPALVGLALLLWASPATADITAAAASCNIQGCSKCPKGGSTCDKCGAGYTLNANNTCDCAVNYGTSDACTAPSTAKECRCVRCPASKSSSAGGPLATTRCIPLYNNGTFTTTISMGGDNAKKVQRALLSQLKSATGVQPNVKKGSVKVVAGASSGNQYSYSVYLQFPRAGPNPASVLAAAINSNICSAFMPAYDFCAKAAKAAGQPVTNGTAQDVSPPPPYPVPSAYYVIAVSQDVMYSNRTQPPQYIPPQPYKRGLGHVRVVDVTLGSGSNKATYLQTIDTGSGLLNMPCKTPATTAFKCDGASMFELKPENYGTAAQCAAIMNGSSSGGGGCYSAGANPAVCSWAQGLTGGGQINMNDGVMSFNTPIAVKGLVASSNTSMGSTFTMVGAAACAEFSGTCQAGEAPCLSAWSSCPPSPLANETKCTPPGGIEMGFTFTPTAVPGQLAASKAIKPILGVCFTQLPVNTDCSKKDTNNDFITLGDAPLPSDVLPSSVIASPIFEKTWEPSGVPLGPANNPMMTTNEFRSIIASTLVPGYTCTNATSGCTNQAPFTFNFTVPSSPSLPSINMSNPAQVGLSILWDTGAYGVEHVDSLTFNAYFAGFQARLADLQGQGGFKIETCDYNQTWELCGQGNFEGVNPQNPFPLNACNMIKYNSDADQAAATALLQKLHPNPTYSLWPFNTPATLQGGWTVLDCGTKAVASCSYIQNSTNAWVGGPWFSDKWHKFDITTPYPGVPASWGTYSFAPSACPYGK